MALLPAATLAGPPLGGIPGRRPPGVGSTVPAVAAMELLLEDPINPRSVRYQLERLLRHFDTGRDPALVAAIGGALDLVTAPDHDALFANGRAGLAELLESLDQRLRDLARVIERTHFAPQATSRAFAVPEFAEEVAR